MYYQLPEITLELNCLIDFNDVNLAKKFIDIINNYEEFIPTKYAAFEPLENKYIKSNIDPIIDTWMNMENRKKNLESNYILGRLLMEKSRYSKASYYISWEKTQQAHFNFVCFSIDIVYIKKNNQDRFLLICNEFIKLFQPVQGEIQNGMDKYSFKPIDLKLRYPELQWYNIFSL